jgi:MOSC domain-containing protein YiiM
MEGVVHAINVSDGGIPKRARAAAWIDVSGVEGDRQRDLRFHGGPDRAVSLYSLDLIEALRADGHPIAPGTIGENLTLSGIDWNLMVPGVRVEIADVLLEITAFTAPCRNIAASFQDGAFVRVSQKAHPGWSRLYARVLVEGRIETGMPVRISPPAPAGTNHLRQPHSTDPAVP